MRHALGVGFTFLHSSQIQDFLSKSGLTPGFQDYPSQRRALGPTVEGVTQDTRSTKMETWLGAAGCGEPGTQCRNSHQYSQGGRQTEFSTERVELGFRGSPEGRKDLVGGGAVKSKCFFFFFFFNFLFCFLTEGRASQPWRRKCS